MQVAALLGYAEPQVLDIFKNTSPTRLYSSRNEKKDINKGKIDR